MEGILRKVSNPPNPGRLIESLRDSGYSFNTAIADIIDNSIVADAENVHIKVLLDYEGDVQVHIIDDGIGMDEQSLLNAMKYGSEKQSDPKSLSKFGLGLKTASTGFCRNLSVTSRDNGSSDLNKACWDLNYIAEEANGEWSTLFLKVTEDDSELIENVAPNHSGTLVSWKKVDRLTKKYQNPGGADHKKAIDKLINSLKEHISLVFQRYLDVNDKRARNINVFVNSTKLEPWDPFCTGEEFTELVGIEEPVISIGDDKETKIQIKAYILPTAEQYSSAENLRKAKPSTDNQGVYVYRENRLIYGPSWLKIFSNDPHLNLLRVEFSFDYLLDEAFKIDFMKSKVEIDENIFDFLKRFLGPPRRAADQKYRKKQNKEISKKSTSAHDSSNKSIENKSTQIPQASITDSDAGSSSASIKNKQGEFVIKIPIMDPAKEGEVRIQPIDNIEDGLLWQPCLIDTKQGVQINTGHDYYKKVYVPNYQSGVAIQGLDSLLWALSIAEFSAYHPNVKELFEQLRLDVSRTLRKLVEDLPEPDLEEDEL